MLDLAILGLLQEGDLHGYEIRRRLRQSLGLVSNVSFGTLYPALARLEAAGAVRSVAPLAPTSEAPSGPATGSLSGELAALRARRSTLARPKRSKKVYRLTDEGRVLFTELLADTGAGDDARAFSLRLSLGRHLTVEARTRLLERQHDRVALRLAEVTDAASSAELDSYARCVVEHQADTLSNDLAWLERLIAAERASQHQPTTTSGRHAVAPANS